MMHRSFLIKNAKNLYSNSSTVRQIGNVVINNPPVNTLTRDTLLKLAADIKTHEAAGEKAIILSSPNRVFSAGLDLKAFAVASKDELRAYWLAFIAAQRALYNTPLLTVAAISGHAPAGGCIFSLCCDYRVIAKDAKIGLNEAAFGITPPVMPMYMAQDVMGKLRAERFLSQGTMLTSAEAFENNLVDVIVDQKTRGISSIKGLPEFTTSGEAVSVDSVATELAFNLTGHSGSDIPGRSATKKMFRDQVDELVYGTPEKIEKDVENFVTTMTSDKIRNLIRSYLESLQKKK